MDSRGRALRARLLRWPSYPYTHPSPSRHEQQTWTADIVARALHHSGKFKQSDLLGYLSRFRKTQNLYGPVLDQFINGYLFKHFIHGDGAPLPRFSRHAILHGVDTAYGTKDKSLTALVWVDYLLMLVSASQAA
jgi:hypothetical protein